MSKSLSDLELENLDEETKAPPETRIANAKAGRDIFMRMFEADRPRALHRSRHQALRDGQPPYDQNQLIASGQAGRTNVNWGDSKAVSDVVISGAVDMNVSVETLVSAPLFPWVVTDDEERKHFETILADEITKAFRDWEEFNSFYLSLAHYTFNHGVGIAFFDDTKDWRPTSTGLGDMLIPDGTRASENCIAVASCVRYMEPHEMFAKIRHEEKAAAMGWNVPAVKQAILEACPDTHFNQNWEVLQKAMKNNDLGFGYSNKTSKVGVIHQWAQEFDGTVSKYMLSYHAPRGYQGNSDAEPWLFQSRGFYPEMRQGMIFFTYGIGNGTYHSISGLLREIYPQALALNRTQSNMLDAANFATSLIIQPLSEAHMSRMRITNLGTISIAPAEEHGKIIEMNRPNVAQAAMPVVADLRDIMAKRAGQFQGDSVFGGSQEKTRFQVAAELEALGKVGATQSNLWYPPWTRLMREMTRRICRLDYSAGCPGGKEAERFRKRLEMRGFPLELLKAIDFEDVSAERPVGDGSGAARIARLTQLRELSGDYDEIGKYNLVRDLTAASLNGNYQLADRYIPRVPDSRAPLDKQIANLENSLMRQGQEAKIEPGQMPIAHLDAHIPFLIEMVQEIEGGTADLGEIVMPLVMCHEHATAHLETIAGSELLQEKVAEYKQILQQLGEVVQNSLRKHMAEQQRAAEEAMEAGEEQQGDGMSPAMQEKLVMSQLKLEAMQTQAAAKEQYKEREHMQKLRHNEESFRQQKAFKDAGTATNLLARSREQMQQAQITNAKAVQDMRINKIKAAENAKKPKAKPK